MPTIGGVYIPDRLLASLTAPPPPRPGYGAIFGAAAEGTARQLASALPYQFDVLTQDKVDPAAEARYKQGLDAAQAAFSRAPASSVADLTSGRTGFARFALENIVASAPQMLGTLAGTAAGVVAGGPGGAVLGGIAAGTPMFSASNVARRVQEQGSLDVAGAESALGIAPLQAASDVLAERFLPGAGKLFGGLAATQSGNFLARTAKSIVKAGATEAVTEAGQQLGERVAAGIPTTNADAVGEYVNAAVTAFAVGGVLGSAGGFRRHAADAKPPTMVTNEDMNAKLDELLLGNMTPSTQGEKQFGLPLAGGQATEQQLGLRGVDPAPVEEPAPSSLPQLPGLNPPLSSVPVDTQLELGQRFEDNVSPIDITALGGAEITPQLQDLLRQTSSVGTPPLTASTTLSNAPVLGFDPAAQEAPTPAAPVEIAPADPIDFQKHVDGLKKGLRGGFVQSVEATDELDLVGKVYDQIFINQDTRANTTKFAQRLGVLDENLEPTPLAKQIEAERAAPAAEAATEPSTPAAVEAAPAPDQAQTFAATWDAIKKSAGIQRLTTAADLNTPTDLPSAQVSVMSALATDKSNAETSQIEKLAKKMGLVTDDDARDVTPLGRQAFLGSPDGITAVSDAAVQQGFAGDQTNAFAQGVSDALSGATAPATVDATAHQAGQDWAKTFVESGDVKTAAQTEAVRLRQAGRENGVAEDRTQEASRVTLTPEQIAQRDINTNLLDNADLSAVKDTDVQTLRRMTRDGATADEVGQALEKAQRGESLFTQPDTVRPDLPGVVVDRRANYRAQLAEQARLDAAQTSAPIPGAKLMQRAQDAKLIARHDAIEDIKDAHDAGELTNKQALLAMSKANAGDIDGARAVLPERLRPSKYMMVDGKPQISEGDRTAAKWILSTASVTKNVHDVMQHLVDLGGELGAMAKRLQPLVPDVNVRVMSAERIAQIDGVAKDVDVAAGERVLGLFDHNTSTLYLADEMTHPSIALHEIAHAIVDNHIFTNSSIGKEIKSIYARFERFGDKADYAFASPYEFMAEFLSRRQVRDYVQSFEDQGKVGNIFQRAWAAIRKALGGSSQNYVERLLNLAEAAGQNPVDGTGGLINAYKANETTQAFTTKISEAVDNLNTAEWSTKFRRMALGWQSQIQIDRRNGAEMPGLVMRTEAYREQGAVLGRFEQMGAEQIQQFDKYAADNKQGAAWVTQLMDMSTVHQLDPDKTWAEHTHHKDSPQAGRLQQLHGEVRDLANKLRRGDGTGMKLFNDFRMLNEAQNSARMAATLHGLVAMDPELALGVENADINPVDGFMREQGLNTPAALATRWSALLLDQLKAVNAFVADKKGEAARGTESDQRAMRSHLSPIELQVNAIHEALGNMRKAPYFHLGRFGDYFGAATVRSAKGVADPVAVRHVAQVLEKAGFRGVQISDDNTRPRIAMRFEKLDQARQFQKLMQELKQQGWLDEKADVIAGPRDRSNNYGAGGSLPEFVRAYVERIEAAPMYVPTESMGPDERAALEKQKADAVKLAVDTWLEQQPDNSISKVLTKRYNVSGYDADMVRSWVHRWSVGARAIAGSAAAPKFNRAYVSMRSQANEATTRDVAEATKLNDLMTEMRLRDARNPINDNADTFDTARGFAHAYFLGLSPAYGIVNMTQLGVTALPELAKTHGYTKSFHAMRRASGAAFKILKAAGSEAWDLGGKHLADVTLTDRVLVKANLSPAERSFALHMIATGTIDIGSAARAFGQASEGRGGSRVDTALKFASVIGLYTEVFSRLVTALAARELHGGKPDAEAYATKVVSNSMFDYQNWNTARQLGKQGFAGPVTPLLTQFMSYSVQVMEKLYSEVLDGFQRARPGESAEAATQRKTEARRFLLGHLTAVTTLAGTLGMPFATVFATVIERLVDAVDDDDDPYDATAAWRGFLANVLGKDVAEVVARGVPRALGFDISGRAGEQSLLPFSEFLADRRSWKDAVANASGKSIGAVPSMAINILDGGSMIGNGDVLGGMKQMLPVAFKGPTEAYRMTTDGYVDTKGNKLPLSPTASAFLVQLLGLTPSAKAEYSEARGDQASRRGEIARQADTLRKQIVKAMISGDTEAATGLVERAQKFDQDNPAFGIVKSIPGALTSQVQAQSRARSLGAPIGVSAQDIAGQRLTSYANF